MEKGQLDRLVQFHAWHWTQLETAMANLLHQVTHIEEGTRIAHAIYYALEGFHARQSVVNAAIAEWVYENRADLNIGGLWDRLHSKLNGARRMRNTVAHGSVRWFEMPDGRQYVRLLPALVDTKVVKATRDGKIPGETAHNVKVAVERLEVIVECVNLVNAFIGSFRRNDATALPQIFAELESHLNRLEKTD